MEEKIIREKNRTFMKKIVNDNDRLKEQKKLEVVDCGLSYVEWGRRLPAGAVETGDYGVRWPAGSRKKKGEFET